MCFQKRKPFGKWGPRGEAVEVGETHRNHGPISLSPVIQLNVVFPVVRISRLGRGVASVWLLAKAMLRRCIFGNENGILLP